MKRITVTPDILEFCTGVRRHLHRFPEVSFREENTADYIITRLAELGIKGKRVAGTGVYAVVDSGRPGPVVAFRADTDALALQEENNAPYASSVPGVAHGCGHDGHVAVLMGLAAMLVRSDNIRGKVILVFQPAEEVSPGGALAVIESGVLEGVEAVLGLHLITLLPLGTIGLRKGPLMASMDNFRVEITGRGGHGSMPHLCVDPIVTGARLVNAWNGISRSDDPLDPVALTVGTFNSGTADNIIPETAVLTGTVRTLSEETRAEVEEDFRRVAEEICKSAGAKIGIDYYNGYPVLVCDDSLTALVDEAIGLSDNVNRQWLSRPFMGSEDFAYYRRLCPVTYFFLGAGNTEKGYVHPNHSPHFDFDEEALAIGVQVFLDILSVLWGRTQNSDSEFRISSTVNSEF